MFAVLFSGLDSSCLLPDEMPCILRASVEYVVAYPEVVLSAFMFSVRTLDSEPEKVSALFCVL